MTLASLVIATLLAPPFTVMSYNVYYGRPGDAATIEAIRSGDADVVCLQETNDRWERALRKAFGDEYPHMTFREHGRAGGLAVLSRFPVEAEELVEHPSGRFPAMRHVIHAPGGKVQVLNVHLLPNRRSDGSWVRGYLEATERRAREIAHFAAALVPDVPTIIVGDFNEPAFGKAIAWLEARGYATVLGRFQPGQHTWRWPSMDGEYRFELDHVVHGPGVEVVSARVIDAGRSDHLPVVADVRVRLTAP